ncbi:MAG: hypothetical protein JWP44_4534 [Mucilaginibacter sp.]|nr:hypothetical protein [Mucilaginibacter sp.]
MNALANAINPPAPLATDEWATPPEILERVLAVYGGTIDLDPCADEACSVPARCHYTRQDNGLVLPWSGKVFANPPYSKPLLGMFIEHFRREWRGIPARPRHEPMHAIFLIPARTDTGWFQPLWEAKRIVFLKGRLHFSGSKSTGRFASALAYFGPKPGRFEDEFSDLGQPVRP